MPTNEERADSGHAIARRYAVAKYGRRQAEIELRDDPEGVYNDILADLMHACAERGLDWFDARVTMARDHFHTERGSFDSTGRT